MFRIKGRIGLSLVLFSGPLYPLTALILNKLTTNQLTFSIMIVHKLPGLNYGDVELTEDQVIIESSEIFVDSNEIETDEFESFGDIVEF